MIEDEEEEEKMNPQHFESEYMITLHENANGFSVVINSIKMC